MTTTIQENQKSFPRRTRRDALKLLSSGALASTVFGRALAALGAGKTAVTDEMLRQAQWVAGLDLTEAERKLMLEGVEDALAQYEKLRKVPVDNAVPPAFSFHPAPWRRPEPGESRGTVEISRTAVTRRPESPEDLAFAPITELAPLLRTRQVSSVALTQAYLDRLRRFDPALQCVITYTEELALKQAEQADQEIARGNYRGPLHGIPWGAKDILAVPGYRTTWGAMPYKEQLRPEESAVVARLREAGAVLVAKLSVGALAMGDVWFGGTTKSPWNLEWGSSGSSAGSAAATAAGLVGFAIGTETGGVSFPPAHAAASPDCGRLSAA